MSELQGGTFGHGFTSAAFGAALAPQVGRIDGDAGQIVGAAVVGGTASVLSGGKFGNGALTAAFSYALHAQRSSEVTGSSVGHGGGGSDFEKLAKDSATVQEIMVSPLDGTGDLSAFGYEVNARIQELTFSTGYEYRATFGMRAATDWLGREGVVYAATISTSYSPVVSAPAMLAPNGFQYMPGLDMHSHAPFLRGYRLTKLDSLYLAKSGISYSAGTRLDSKLAHQLTNGVNFYRPSPQDLRGASGGFLSTPDGLVFYGH